MAKKIATVLVLGMSMVALRGQQAGTQAVIEVKPPEVPRRPQSPADSITENTVTIGGQKIDYQAVAGTITVGGTDAYDALLASDGQLLADAVVNPTDPAKPEDAPARAQMFYTAYFRKGAAGRRGR